MKLTQTPLAGAWLVDIEPIEDPRGLFARSACMQEFANAGLDAAFVQQSVSWNRQRGVLRGLHYQDEPYAEDKLVRVTHGAIFDVIVDLRPASPTRFSWYGVELTARSRRALYIPKGFAHGFQTLEDDTEILYQMTVPFHAAYARGLRWNDPVLNISWPDASQAILSDKDAALPLIQEASA